MVDELVNPATTNRPGTGSIVHTAPGFVRTTHNVGVANGLEVAVNS